VQDDAASVVPDLDARVYAIAEPEDDVLRAFDDAGGEALRASCREEDTMGWSYERDARPGFGHRRASVIVTAACTGSFAGTLDVWTRRVEDVTLVVACRAGDCEPFARSLRITAR
jgi:hypothetical protein